MAKACFLVSTEKAYSQQNNSVYTMAFWDKSNKMNKIELTKILKKLNVEVQAINTSNTYQKLKKKGKKSTLTKQYRPKKYFVKTVAGSVINDEIVAQINTLIYS
jgi:ribosomal protein L23